ncbi:dihydrofolate reductase family protein [Kribbella deserti]|uniref:Dihydrofolate reductase family protein n=1 Tax=Kribbella deserti TaxID=1926257 RepID=A0ABV6QLH0_9ACTN
MRKLIVTVIVSLDGYFEGPGKNVMALPMDPAFDAHNLERLRAASTLLLGRTTYQGFASYWPGVADDQNAPEVEREISRINNTIEKVVISDTLNAAEVGSAWADTTEVVPVANAFRRIAELKAGEGGDIVMFGSQTLWSALLAEGLVDELYLMYGPVALGGGTPAFNAGETARMSLLGVRTFEGSDNFVARYDAQPR